ncbi:hypothetical protein Bbelb_230670 [Branchiostoma belcheri]|nr:hypothetical protein Bbelb_230670 [Branchiostoma belcheri]
MATVARRPLPPEGTQVPSRALCRYATRPRELSHYFVVYREKPVVSTQFHTDHRTQIYPRHGLSRTVPYNKDPAYLYSSRVKVACRGATVVPVCRGLGVSAHKS